MKMTMEQKRNPEMNPYTTAPQSLHDHQQTHANKQWIHAHVPYTCVCQMGINIQK